MLDEGDKMASEENSIETGSRATDETNGLSEDTLGNIRNNTLNVMSSFNENGTGVGPIIAKHGTNAADSMTVDETQNVQIADSMTVDETQNGQITDSMTVDETHNKQNADSMTVNKIQNEQNADSKTVDEKQNNQIMNLSSVSNDNNLSYNLAGNQENSTHEYTEMQNLTNTVLINNHNEPDIKAQYGYNMDEESMAEKEALINGKQNGEPALSVDDSTKHMRYRISDTPPFYLCIFFAFQQCLMSLPSSVKATVIVAEVMCARDEEGFKAQILSISLLMSGLCTLFQNTLGVRLPVYQGPVSQYVIPLLLLLDLPEFSCPARHDVLHESAVMNSSMTMSWNATMLTNQTVPNVYFNEVVLPRFRQMSGSLMVAGAIHTLIGASGMVGVLLRFIGPITVIPTILLVGLNTFTVVTRFCQTHWGIAILTAAMALILSMYLGKRQMPVLAWSKDKGFHLGFYPLHQVLSIMIAILIGWSVSAIMTVAGALSSDKDSVEFYARTDSRSYVIADAPWFTFPYPGMHGVPSFSSGVLVAFLTATITSIIDSIADYYACARVARVPPPPPPAVNRGIMVEGIFSLLAGAWGAAHATTTYGGNIGVIGITKVASRRVFQLFACMFIVCAVVGKFGAFFVTIPYPVLGGTQIVGFGIFVGLVLSNLQFIDLQSTRNLAIIGISILVGLMIPYWTKQNSQVIDTGNIQIDNFIKMLMTNPNFPGGLIACFLDNTVPGTLKERGLIGWQTAEVSEDGETSTDYCEGLEVYEIPSWTAKLRKFKFAKYVPIFPTYNPSKESKAN